MKNTQQNELKLSSSGASKVGDHIRMCVHAKQKVAAILGFCFSLFICFSKRIDILTSLQTLERAFQRKLNLGSKMH